MKPTKSLLLILILSFGLNSFSQSKWDTKERFYSGGVILSGLIDVAQGKVLALKPSGKNVSIKYDPFYDKYTIDWSEEEGPSRMVLKFSEENSGGQMYVDSYSSNTPYFVHDNIRSENKLTLMGANSLMVDNRKVKLIFVIEDLK